CTPEFFAFCKTSGCDIVKYNQGSFKDGIAWYDLTESRYLNSSEQGLVGHKYRICVYVAANDGYSFATKNDFSALNAKVNGQTASVIDYSSAGFRKSQKEVLISFDFAACDFQTVTSVSELIERPAAAKTPDFDLDGEYDDYAVDDLFNGDGFINGVKWMQLKKESNGEMTIVKTLGKNDVFDHSSPYRVYIRLVTRSGRSFAVKANGQPDVTAKVNGGTAYAVRCDSNTNAKYYLNVACDFEQVDKNTISSVSISSLSEPVGGETASTACTTGTEYTVKSAVWKDLTDSKDLSKSDKFTENHKYSFSATLAAANGCEFKKGNQLSVTVNGRDAAVKNNDGTSVTFSVEYTAALSKTITSVSINGVTDPVKGGTPGYSVTVSPAAKCEIDTGYSDAKLGIKNGVQWICSNNTVQVGEKFSAGYWTVNVFLKAKSGFEFEHDAGNTILTTATVNGLSGAVVYCDWISVTETYVSFEFPYSIPSETLYEAGVKLTAPKAGSAPSFAASADSKAYCTSSTSSGNVKNGVSWIDTTTGAYLKESDKFTAGHAYRCSVLLNVSDGYKFSSGVLSCTVNGEPCSYYGGELQADAITLFYDFPQLPGGDKSIEKVSIDGSFAENAVLSSTSLTSSTAGIASVTTEWDCDGQILADGTKVAAGKQYMAYITLKAASGYVFGTNVKVSVFGTEYDAVWTSEQNKTAQFNTAVLSVAAHTHTLKRIASKSATCIEPGIKEYWVCSDCGAKFLDSNAKNAVTDDESLVIAPLGHSISDRFRSDANYHWRTCTRCGAVLDETKMVHEDTNKDGKCDSCAYNLSASVSTAPATKPVSTAPASTSPASSAAATEAPPVSSEPSASSEPENSSAPAETSSPAGTSEPSSAATEPAGSSSAVPSSTSAEPSGEGFPWWIVAVVFGAAAVAAGVTVLIVKKKKAA
ncbi:MAG: hypothetical protein IJU75_03550, partial [Clostridia bacterium]|nr:hypothetical protein [Clostridia bacterium]